MKSSENISKAYELFNEAYALHKQGKIEEAIAVYKESLVVYPTPEAHTFLGWSYSVKKDYERAIDECKLAIEIDPDYGNPYNDIGSYLIALKQYEEAILWLNKAIAAPIYDSKHFPYYNLGRIYEVRGDWVKAIELYREASIIEPTFKSAINALINLTAKLN